jgi:uncharacterized protein (TIGR02284 family)
MSHKSTLKHKLDCLAIHTNDSVEGYKKAAERLGKMDSAFATHFRAQAEIRQNYADEINSRLKCVGEDSQERNSLEGKAHHALIDLKGMVLDDNADTILDEAIRGEEKLVDYIDDTLGDLDVIDGETTRVLNQYRTSVLCVAERS